MRHAESISQLAGWFASIRGPMFCLERAQRFKMSSRPPVGLFHIFQVASVAAAVMGASLTVQTFGEEPAKTYKLRYNFRTGSSVDYTVENRAEIEVEQAETRQQVEHSEITHKHYRVVSTDANGNGTLELMIDRVQMQASVDGVTPVTYDSQADQRPPAQFLGIADTIGKPLARITVSPTGKLLDLNWLLAEQQGHLPTREDAGNLDILVELPDGPVAVGETWKQRFETEVLVEQNLRKAVTLQRTYRLSGVEGDRATIELKTAVITPLHDPEQEAQLIQKTPQGTVVFDLKRGLLIARSTELDREVVGFNGGKSRIRNRTTRSEQLVEHQAQSADGRPVQTAEQPRPDAR